MLSQVKILIGVPCYSGRVVVETISSLLSAIQYHGVKYPHHQVDVKFQVRNFTTYAAERLCERALSGYDYLLFWGDDMVPPFNVIERLLSHNKDMVACAVFARSEPYAFYAFDENDKMFHVKRLNTGLQKVTAAGTGVMLIKTSVFKNLSKPWWVWPNDDSTDVDREFCLRVAKEQGTEIWVDTNMEVGHLDFTPNVINHKTHQAWIESIKSSGVLNLPEAKQHKDYPKLEAIVYGT